MNFKVKAWMIYFAGIVATPLIAKMIVQNNITPEELARAALSDLLSERDQDIRIAAGRVLQKYSELYRRLA